MAGNHELPLDCTHCSEGQVLVQRMSTLEQTVAKHLERFDTHMEREEEAFRRIYEKLDTISRDIGNVHNTALKDRMVCKTEIESNFAKELSKIESQFDGFVTKSEVRMIWGVVTTVILGALWFFSNVQLHDSDGKQDVLIELNKTQTAILNELKMLRGNP